MDQEDFEEMASIGEPPVGVWRDHPILQHVCIPAAADSGHHHIISTPNEPGGIYDLYFDSASGRIAPADFHYAKYFGDFPADDRSGTEGDH